MNTHATTTTAGVDTDAEKVATLRCYGLTVWHKPGTPLEQAAVRIHFETECAGFIPLKIIDELVDHFTKLAMTVNSLGTAPTPADTFSYRILKDAGIFDAYAAIGKTV